MSSTVVEVTVTVEDIEAAKRGEGYAQELVIGSLASQVRSMADKNARAGHADMAEDLYQAGMIAIWETLGNYTVTTVTDFRGYMIRVAYLAIVQYSTAERHPGADRRAVEVFAYWVKKTDGDLDLAQRLAQESADGGGRLGRDRAWAARQAWSGTASIDAAVGEDEGDVASIADMLVSDLGIPEEWLTSDDMSRRDREARIALVRAILDTMGPARREVLMLTHGIDCGQYGMDNEAIANLMGSTARKVSANRYAGYKQFAEKWINVVKRDEADAETWWAAYHAERAR